MIKDVVIREMKKENMREGFYITILFQDMEESCIPSKEHVSRTSKPILRKRCRFVISMMTRSGSTCSISCICMVGDGIGVGDK